MKIGLIVLGLNDTSTLVGHSVLSPRESEKRARRESRDKREGQGSKENKRAMIWPCNAHLSITAIREPDLELIKANILTKIRNDYINK